MSRNTYSYVKKISALFLTGLFLLYSGCFDSDEGDVQAQLEQDLITIDAYLSAHAIVALADSTGRIRYVVHNATESGIRPTLDSCITARFQGKFLDTDAVFAQSTGSSFPLGGDVIQGWKLCLPLIDKGDSVTFYVPSGLAYGPSGLPLQNIPPNANVYFTIKLLDVGTTYSASPSPTGSCK